MLASTAFRTSKQARSLLQYLVNQAIGGHDAMFKERIVGVNVFARNPDYNTGDDPIVRVRASDLRKRLAQYYAGEGAESPIRIQIHQGSYQPVFTRAGQVHATDHAPEAVSSLQTTPEFHSLPIDSMISNSGVSVFKARRLRRRYYILAGTIACLLGVACTVLVRQTQKTATDLFWEPVLNSSRPVLIYFGTNAVYQFSREFLNRYRTTHNVEQEGQEFFVDLPGSTKIDAGDIGRAEDYVAGSDFAAATPLISLLNRRAKAFELRWGHDISIGDLRDGPVILVGGFNNELTLEVTRSLHFVFEGGNHVKDRSDSNRIWSVVKDSRGHLVDDYAVVSRLIDPKTGAILITVAGIGPDATQAAGEFLGSQHGIDSALKGAPTGWPKKNMQILLHIKAVYPAPSSVIAESVYCW